MYLDVNLDKNLDFCPFYCYKSRKCCYEKKCNLERHTATHNDDVIWLCPPLPLPQAVKPYSNINSYSELTTNKWMVTLYSKCANNWNSHAPQKKVAPIFHHKIIALHGFQNHWNFCDISFCFRVIGKRLVYIFFLTVHIF